MFKGLKKLQLKLNLMVRYCRRQYEVAFNHRHDFDLKYTDS